MLVPIELTQNLRYNDSMDEAFAALIAALIAQGLEIDTSETKAGAFIVKFQGKMFFNSFPEKTLVSGFQAGHIESMANSIAKRYK